MKLCSYFGQEGILSGPERGRLERQCVRRDRCDGSLLVFDASPWGYGGVLQACGVPKSWYASPTSKEDVVRFTVAVGSPKDQTLVETSAILIVVRMWDARLSSRCLVNNVRSDSQAALGAGLK